MSLTEMLDKQKRLSKKIEAEENRVKTVENKKLSELKTSYDTKQKILDQWYSDVKNYLIDRPADERFNAMMEQFVASRAKYAIERDVGKVSKEFLARIQPKSFKELISLYRLEGWFNDMNSSCDTAQACSISEAEVSKAKREYEKYKAKVTDRRNK